MIATEDDATLPALDDLISLREAASMLPSRSRGKKTHVATMFRWTTVGCRGVKLRYLNVGATRCTTREWLDEFFAALTAASSLGGSAESRQSNAQSPASKPAARIGIRTPAERRRAHAKAMEALAEAGI